MGSSPTCPVKICYVMNNKKTSPIWKIDKEVLTKLVKESTSLAQILNYFGLCNKGRNSSTLKKRLQKDCIDFSHIRLGINSNKNRAFDKNKIDLKKVLVKDSHRSIYKFKKRLISEKLLEEKCQECGLKNEWNGRHLTLQIDHINGISNDNRLENLRFLCPNCHSQTSTFAGKSNKKLNNCLICEKQIKNKSKYCRYCKLPKVEKPSKKVLQKMIWKIPTSQIAKNYQVSDTTVKNWCKHYEIKKPGRGYWAKVSRLV